MSLALSLAIEKASYLSWPAFEQEEYRGWVLRAAGGYTKRANSTNVIAKTQEPLTETVAHCEAFFKSRMQPPIFRMFSFVEDTALDSHLANNAYSYIDPSLVLYRPIDESMVFLDKVPPAPEMDRMLWLDEFCEVTGANRNAQATHAKILGRVPGPSLFTIRKHKETTVSCGLGVQSGEYFGIFDIVTRQQSRQQGHGTALVKSMLAWARKNGAKHAYLQVLASNETGIRLYENLGYRRLYQYWYRVKKKPAGR